MHIVSKIDFSKKICNVITKDGITIPADAIVIATGYNTFDARLKEEFGYGIYDNVITSVELEQMFKKQEIITLVVRSLNELGLFIVLDLAMPRLAILIARVYAVLLPSNKLLKLKSFCP